MIRIGCDLGAVLFGFCYFSGNPMNQFKIFIGPLFFIFQWDCTHEH